jgi:hypothetical protein
MYADFESLSSTSTSVQVGVDKVYADATPETEMTLLIGTVDAVSAATPMTLSIVGGLATYVHTVDPALRYYYWARLYETSTPTGPTVYLGSFDNQEGSTLLLRSAMTLVEPAVPNKGGPTSAVMHIMLQTLAVS